MAKNKQIRLFLIGFVVYAIGAFLYGWLNTTPGAFALGGVFLFGAGICGLLMFINKYG